MILISSSFVTSNLTVSHNAVKNILFRISALCLQLGLYKLFSFFAFKMGAYTSFLMFAEDLVQQGFYIIARGISKRSAVVLGFVILFTAAGFWDTLLWALDSPGYAPRSKSTQASSLSPQLLNNPSYIVSLSDPLGDTHTIKIDEAMTGNLFRSGLNVTVSDAQIKVPSEIVPPPTNKSFALVGPRIWLDEDLSVSVDQTIMISPHFYCPTSVSEATLAWRCILPNSTIDVEFLSQPVGQPEIWWDDSDLDSEVLGWNRADNQWQTLSIGGDTAAMKQVFTVTKGRRRHTFLETALKISMLSVDPIPLADAEVTEMIRRVWSSDTDQPIEPAVKALADFAIEAQNNGTGIIMGAIVQLDNVTVASSSIELLNIDPNSDNTGYNLLRLTSTNITLIRSETLLNPVVPLEPCDLYNTNIASGGRVHSTTCYKSTGNQTGARFLGQLDVSSMVIVTEVLGDGSKSTSAQALNQTGLEWFLNASNHLDAMLISRGVILGGDSATIQVEVINNVPAISYLQLLLIVVPILFSVIATMLMFIDKPGYYKNSFLSAVCATIHTQGSDKCMRIGYLRSPPEISPTTLGNHMVLGTPGGGSISNVTAGQGLLYGLGSEPLSGDLGSAITDKDMSLSHEEKRLLNQGTSV